MVARQAVERAFWCGRRVLVTGHTGFKGAWLSLWLQTLGAEVIGFSLRPSTAPSLYEVADVGEGMHNSVEGDVRDLQAVTDAFARCRPEVVIHMAAQPFVRRSYAQPAETFAVNVLGTVNVLEAARRQEGVRVVVNVTSDKCYEHGAPSTQGAQGDHPERGGAVRFKEGDPLGGADPYSASKGAAELVTAAYRRSFFADPDGPRLASARAGNVIGGGDWGEDRLVADAMKAALSKETVIVRNPGAIRPWQHVLCPLAGYLLLAQALWDSPELAGAWNFGPDERDERAVGWVVERLAELWSGRIEIAVDKGSHPPEAPTLRLDSTKARERLGWQPAVGLERGLQETVAWWLALAEGKDMRQATLLQIEDIP